MQTPPDQLLPTDNFRSSRFLLLLVYLLVESVERAKDYISGALAAMLGLGKGSGPMDHGFAIKNEYTKEAKD